MFQQIYDPVANSLWFSALFAALPLLTLFILLGGLRWKAWQAGLASLVVALGVAIFVYGMPVGQAMLSGTQGAAFGLFPILWIVLNAIWIYKLTEATGWDSVLRRAFCSLSDDQRIQAIIIAFCFGALMEALAGFGTPVAVSAVMLMAVGLQPFKAAAVALVANTAPVAFGAIAVPITTLAKITNLDPDKLGAMVGRQTPLLAVVVPLILVAMVDGRRGMKQVWPAAMAAGLGFGIAQYLSSNFFSYQIADIVAAFVGALAVVVLLQVWQPKEVMRAEENITELVAAGGGATTPHEGHSGRRGGTANAVATGGHDGPRDAAAHRRETGEGSALLAFAPYLLIVVMFTLANFGWLKTWLADHSGWKFGWPGLDIRNSAGKALTGTTFNFNIVSAAGTTLLIAGLITLIMYKISLGRGVVLFGATIKQFAFTIITVMAVLALSYVMNFSGQTVTLGQALAQTGGFFAFLSPIVGWIGVAVTGSDTSSNSLFGVLQTTAADKTGISPYLLAAANSSGGVLGKMVSPQNLAIAAASVGMVGEEAALFRSVLKWSLGLLLVMALLVLLQSTAVLGWMVVTA